MIVGCVPPDFSFHGPGTRYLLSREILPEVGNVRYITMAFSGTTVATVTGGGLSGISCGAKHGATGQVASMNLKFECTAQWVCSAS